MLTFEGRRSLIMSYVDENEQDKTVKTGIPSKMLSPGAHLVIMRLKARRIRPDYNALLGRLKKTHKTPVFPRNATTKQG